MKLRIILLLCCFILLSVQYSNKLAAQTTKQLECREPVVSKEKIKQLIESRNNKQNLRTQSTTKQIRVYFHICTNDGGTQPGATEAQVLAEFQRLESDYANGNICFVYAGLNVIANTTLNHIDLDNNSDAEDLFEAQTIPGCLNVFYTNEIRGTNASSGGTIGGYAFDIPNTFCLVANGNLGGNTTSHEIGHCLGLFHTFSAQGFGYEYIDGSGCTMRGDLICDTRADPYAYRGEACYSESGGLYTGYCEDPDDNRNFNPPYTNIMSYWGHNPEVFTSGQFDAVHYTIEDDGDIQNTASASDYTLFSSSYFAGGFHKSAINNFTTIGKVEFGGAVMAGLYGKTVTLTSGFYAHPQAFPMIIRATDCNATATTSAPVARTSSPPETKTTKQSLNTQLIIYPNPATSYFSIQYNEIVPFNAFLTVKNVNGSIVYTMQKRNVTQVQEKIYMSGKAKGVYFVELIAGTKRLTGKVVLQ